jgi:hypothetical protein
MPLSKVIQFHECQQVNGANPLPARRFPPPWSVQQQDACFVVRDRHGQALAYIYFEDEPGRRAAAKLLAYRAARERVSRTRRNNLMNRPSSDGPRGTSNQPGVNALIFKS